MPAIKIYDKLTSLRYIFLYQVWLFTRPKFSRKFIQRADVLHTVCFPACLFEFCAKCVEGQCSNFFPGVLCVHEFSLNFPLREFFLDLARPPPPSPHNFSNGPSPGTVANLDAGDFLYAVSGFGHFFIVSGVPPFV